VTRSAAAQVAGVWPGAITLRGRFRLNLACVRFLMSKEIHMGMPLFAANALFTPLQQLARAVARRFAVPPKAPAMPRTPGCGSAPSRHMARRHGGTRPLRVLRVVEGTASPSAGRMVISGRMDDVCAELDRLAALEAAAG
jgi:hypothetical protein